MSTDTQTLTGFLLARITEDEAEAREAIAERERVRYVAGHPAAEPGYADTSLQSWPDTGVPAMLVGPERVVAECKSKRALIDALGRSVDPYIYNALGWLAAVYSDHPDYNPDWTP